MSDSNNVDVNYISQLMTDVIISQRTLTKYETKKIRDEYMILIEKRDWKKLLMDVANKIKDSLKLTDSSKNPIYLYTIQTNNKTYNLNKPIITIGRNDECDVLLFDKTSSRLNCVMFIYSQYIIIIDPGSLYGLKTKSRIKKEKQHSLPNKRQPLVFDRNERFILEMGDEVVTFSPKLCVICMNKPREMLSNCGHYIMCQSCFDNIKLNNNNCPICRNILDDGQKGLYIKTYIHDE